MRRIRSKTNPYKNGKIRHKAEKHNNLKSTMLTMKRSKTVTDTHLCPALKLAINAERKALTQKHVDKTSTTTER